MDYEPRNAHLDTTQLTAAWSPKAAVQGTTAQGPGPTPGLAALIEGPNTSEWRLKAQDALECIVLRNYTLQKGDGAIAKNAAKKWDQKQQAVRRVPPTILQPAALYMLKNKSCFFRETCFWTLVFFFVRRQGRDFAKNTG